MSGSSERVSKLVLVPGLITLGVTLLRLAGELQNWSPALFSRQPGGAMALVGIVWLVPVFGAWFGARLASVADRPTPGRLAATAFGSFALFVGGGLLIARLLSPPAMVQFACFVVLAALGGWLTHRAWPTLGRTLLAYGLAARVPVILVTLASVLGEWGTHYDAAPPTFPAMGPLGKWLLLGVLPQLFLWVPFTMFVGALGASLGLWWAGRQGARA